MKTYQEIIDESVEQLAHLDNPKFEAESLLAFVLECGRSQIIAFPEKKAEDDQYVRYMDLVKQRQLGVPFAYLTGEKEFYDLTLKVTPATLIPRADTELLVETALSKLPNDQVCRVIDMGTGSGAIALTLKKHRANATVIAVDQSIEALKIAEENGENLKLAVEFIHSNWFDQVSGADFDLIVSNPPYIEESDEHLVGDGVKYEPITALVAEDDGFSDLFHLIYSSLPLLKNNGWLMMEHGFEQGKRLRDEFISKGYCNVATLQDLGGNDRITIGQKIL